jgi:hypothetical protein
LVWDSPAVPDRETSVPRSSVSIITPFRSAVRRVVVVTSVSRDGGTGMTFVDSVVEFEYDDCANAAPDINVSAVVAAIKVFNITISTEILASGLAR